jgi:hypothetical protein
MQAAVAAVGGWSKAAYTENLLPACLPACLHEAVKCNAKRRALLATRAVHCITAATDNTHLLHCAAGILVQLRTTTACYAPASFPASSNIFPASCSRLTCHPAAKANGALLEVCCCWGWRPKAGRACSCWRRLHHACNIDERQHEQQQQQLKKK